MEENLPVYLFHQGTNYRAYEFLGAHFGRSKGRKGVFFRTWARARRLYPSWAISTAGIPNAIPWNG